MSAVLRLLFIAALASLVLEATAAEPPVETCEQIRAKIGRLPPADHELLRSLAARQECGFTAAEVYRAAYGDKPMPAVEPHRQRHHKEDDDD
jgi:hypothetical protein